MRRDQEEREDASPERVDPDGAQAPSVDAGKLLREREEELHACVDRLQHLQADFENYKKRILREAAAAEERVSDREILDFLPLYDNLRRAFQNHTGKSDSQAFVAGIERIFAQFAEILKQKGVSPMQAVGEQFDPARHEALLCVQSDEEPHAILEEFETGYLRNGRVLRPSKVNVSKGKAHREETP